MKQKETQSKSSAKAIGFIAYFLFLAVLILFVIAQFGVFDPQKKTETTPVQIEQNSESDEIEKLEDGTEVVRQSIKTVTY